MDKEIIVDVYLNGGRDVSVMDLETQEDRYADLAKQDLTEDEAIEYVEELKEKFGKDIHVDYNFEREEE